MKYIVNWPKYPGWPWAFIDDDGTVVGDEHSIGGEADAIILENIIASMKRGVYTKAGYNFKVYPYEDNGSGWFEGKRKDIKTLGQLYAPKKARGNAKGLRPITENDRYKGKIDWEEVRPQIAGWLEGELSLGRIAKRLGVSPSTLSEANKRYRLYPPRKRVA